MATTKGRKIYTVMSECKIIGVWSNLSVLVNDFNKEKPTISYMVVYRKIKACIENDTLNDFQFEFIHNSKVFQLSVELLK